jgi:hypothetical protein
VSPFSPLSLLLLLITTLFPVSVAAMADGPPQPARPPFLSRLPRWLGRWLGYRDGPPSAPPPVYVLYLWPFIGAFCGLSLLQAVFGHARYFIDRGVPSIIASYVSVSPLYLPAIQPSICLYPPKKSRLTIQTPAGRLRSLVLWQRRQPPRPTPRPDRRPLPQCLHRHRHHQPIQPAQLHHPHQR